MLTLKFDNDFRWLGFVGRQAGQLRIAPAGNVYHRPGWRARTGTLVWLYDIQPVAVEKESMVAEQFVQFWNQWMIIGDHLSFDLSESLFDLGGIQFHNGLHWLARGVFAI